MRELRQLIDVEEPAWPELRELFAAGPLSVEVLSPDSDLGGASLLQLQVTARSYLGAMVLHCGGLLVDEGWSRVFGSSVDRAAHGVPSLARVNRFPGTFAPAWRADTGLVVAHDALGGVFALNGEDPAGASRPGARGEVVCFARIPFAGRLWASATRRGWPGWRPGHSVTSTRISAGRAGRTRSGY